MTSLQSTTAAEPGSNSSDSNPAPNSHNSKSVMYTIDNLLKEVSEKKEEEERDKDKDVDMMGIHTNLDHAGDTKQQQQRLK